MIKFFLGTLTVLLVISAPASAQDSSQPSTAAATLPLVSHPVPVRRPLPVHKSLLRTVALSKKTGGGGNWIRLNTHLLGTVGESTWVNLAQAVNIRFYQTGKAAFASVGVGGSSYVSTSDPAEIQKLKAYVLAHQTR